MFDNHTAAFCTSHKQAVFDHIIASVMDALPARDAEWNVHEWGFGVGEDGYVATSYHNPPSSVFPSQNKGRFVRLIGTVRESGPSHTQTPISRHLHDLRFEIVLHTWKIISAVCAKLFFIENAGAVVVGVGDGFEEGVAVGGGGGAVVLAFAGNCGRLRVVDKEREDGD